MRIGTPVYILLRNKFKSAAADPDFVKVPGIVMADPTPASYTNRNTGAIVASSSVEVVSLRDTRGQNPSGGRTWYQATQEPVNLLIRRFDPQPELDGLAARDLYAKVEESIVSFRSRQLTASPDLDPDNPVVVEQQELLPA